MIVEIKALRDSTHEFLKYLNQKNIQLGTKLKVESIQKFDQSIDASYMFKPDESKVVNFSKEVCSRLLVAESEKK
jgi:DtxR family Mn-dependent transcriptional regulator